MTLLHIMQVQWLIPGVHLGVFNSHVENLAFWIFHFLHFRLRSVSSNDIGVAVLFVKTFLQKHPQK